ncbi:Oplophorus-luciferin 2-monooxygenase non-catalytic subunit [Halotydeus destructor]|nr:Oplophorus-luciferin 2-monooxygenase non-catalytic subunit [Halotydeus destructor]
MNYKFLTLISFNWSWWVLIALGHHAVDATWFNFNANPVPTESQSTVISYTQVDSGRQGMAAISADGSSDLDTWCPYSVRMQMSPFCTCKGSKDFAILDCGHFESSEQLKRILSTKFPISMFGKLSITNSTIDRIYEQTVPRDKQFTMVTFKKTALQAFALESFEMSKNTLKRLELVHNKLQRFPYSSVASYQRLINLDLYYNEITSVPDYAFGNNRNLKTINLSFNKISHVGSYAFANLPSLEMLDLKYNAIKVVNNHAFASSLYDNHLLTLDLSNNKMYYLADGAFEGMIAKELIWTTIRWPSFPRNISCH